MVMTQLMLVQTILVNTFHFWLIAHRLRKWSIPIGHFADISATIADNFGVDKAMIGESFLDKLV